MAVESEEDDPVIRMINSAAALRSETLDLGSKRIYEIPNEILNLKHLEAGLVRRICLDYCILFLQIEFCILVILTCSLSS